MEIRAIYLPDARYETASVFRKEGDYFVCMTDSDNYYTVDAVISDKNWAVITVDLTDNLVLSVR